MLAAPKRQNAVHGLRYAPGLEREEKMKQALVVTLTVVLLIVGCATLSSLAYQAVVAELTELFPDVEPEVIEAIADRVVGIGAESLSELCLERCQDIRPKDAALCELICSDPQVKRIGSVSAEADVFFPALIQD
jgi:hypothetical protein